MKHRIHSGLTVAATVEGKKSAGLETCLKQLQGPFGNQPANFSASDTTLFASAVILPECRNENLPETLVFTTTYWGPLSKHLENLLDTNKEHLVEIFSHCSDFPGNSINDEQLICYLKKHRVRGAFNSRYNCIKKKDVEREKHLRAEIENHIDRLQNLIDLNALSAVEVKTLIERHLKINAEQFDWALERDRNNIIEFISINRGKIAIGIIGILLSMLIMGLYIAIRSDIILQISIAILLVVLFLVLLGKLSFRGKHPTACRPAHSDIRKLASSQLHPVINEMTAAAPLKKGMIRRLFYSGALKFINYLSGLFMDVPTVSNIRWLTINENKRLLFLSTYSNTTDFYVRDFLDSRTARGVNFMFTNGVGFPDAKYLFRGGILKEPEGYMNAVHSGQVVTNLWYAHEADLSADNINKNHKIRVGLAKRMNETEAKQWLKLF